MRWTISKKAILFFIVFAAIPLLAQALLAIGIRWSDVHDRVTAGLVQRVATVAGAVDERLARATADFDGYVSMGFARLSAESLAARPGLGRVGARLRAPSSVFPLRTPFESVSILDETGATLWRASEPIDQVGVLIYTSVVSAGAAIDTLGLAGAQAADGEIVVLRRSDGNTGGVLRWLRSFRPDPHDRVYTVCAELPVNELLSGLCADFDGELGRGGWQYRRAGHEHGLLLQVIDALDRVVLDASDSRLIGQPPIGMTLASPVDGEESADRIASIVRRPGSWSSVPPDGGPGVEAGPARWWGGWREGLRQPWLRHQVVEPHLGVSVIGEIGLEPFQRTVTQLARLMLLGAGLAILVGFTVLLAWLNSLRHAVDAVIDGSAEPQ